MDKAKRELIGIIVNSLTIGLKHGHITREEYMSYMQEVKDMQNDSPEETRELIMKLAEERGQRSG